MKRRFYHITPHPPPPGPNHLQKLLLEKSMTGMRANHPPATLPWPVYCVLEPHAQVTLSTVNKHRRACYAYSPPSWKWRAQTPQSLEKDPLLSCLPVVTSVACAEPSEAVAAFFLSRGGGPAPWAAFTQVQCPAGRTVGVSLGPCTEYELLQQESWQDRHSESFFPALTQY